MNQKIKKYYNNFWSQGGLIGLLIPSILFITFFILNSFNIAFGEHQLTTLLLFSIFFLEWPIAILAIIFKIPILASQDAFIVAELNTLGYILVLVSWAHIGALIGMIVKSIKIRFR